MEVGLCADLFNGFSILVLRAEDLDISRLLAISSGQFKLIHTSPLYLRERAEQIQERPVSLHFQGEQYKEEGGALGRRSTLNTVKLELGAV